jgi:hypothetical protein
MNHDDFRKTDAFMNRDNIRVAHRNSRNVSCHFEKHSSFINVTIDQSRVLESPNGVFSTPRLEPIGTTWLSPRN